MNRFFKTAMLWLLVLALPVQGFAAVTQSSCAPRMQQVVATGTVVQNLEHAHHQISAEGVEHAHNQMHAQADQTTNVDADTAAYVPADHQNNTHANVKCSACTTGCMGIAMLPVMPQLPAFSIASSSVVASLSSMLSGHIPDGLKRPPKFFLV